MMYQQNLNQDLLPMPQSSSDLSYEPVETEGQCVLLSVTLIRFVPALYYLFAAFATLLVGIPAVIVYWYPRLKLHLYYHKCTTVEECTHFSIVNYDHQITIVEKQTSQYDSQLSESESASRSGNKEKQTFFINRYMKYTVHNSTVKAALFQYQKKLRRFVNSQNSIKGLNQSTVLQLRRKYGLGTMVIDRPSLLILFLREIVQPLYFFIIATLIIWLSESYYWYCSIIFITSAVGIVINLYQTYTLNNKIYEMAYFQTKVTVLREEGVIEISSKEIVPGDIVFFKDSVKVPFDGLILEGSGLFNECALTGESVPVVRKAEEWEAVEEGRSLSSKNNLICEGTTLIQVDDKKRMHVFEQYRLRYGIPVYVIRTNFVTYKGQLIRIISFPQEKTNVFERQSSKFLIFLFCLAVTSYAILIVKLTGYVEVADLVVKFLDLITITVPPGLPVSMTFGIIYAIEKLKNKQIYCVSPSKVIMGGLVDLICFDKTGTLTEDFMDFHCLVTCFKGRFCETVLNEDGKNQQQLGIKRSIEEVIKKSSHPDDLEHILTNMASNHTIFNIMATGENVGDPMEIKLFEFGEYAFNDSLVSEYEKVHLDKEILFAFDCKRGHHGVVLRRMDFDSELMRMSAIASSNIHEALQYYIYTKGSPQVMHKIFRPESVPQDFHSTLRQYASLGFRVLAIGHREIQEKQLHLDRSQLQTDLIFDGFEVFENRLKPESRPSILELQSSDLPCVMITGDNALTACNISYKSRIADLTKKTYIFDYKDDFVEEQFLYEPNQEDNIVEELIDENDNGKERKEIQMKILQSNFNEMDSKKSELLAAEQEMGFQFTDKVSNAVNKILSKINNDNAQICLTGSAFNKIFAGKLDEMPENLQQVLATTKVYARAKPNDKARIIMAYQQGLSKIVSMCGDGANDCGALKQSDAGLSLSQTQASISSPFTSKVTNISSMIELIKECRAGLVTNFSLFNIMALYSLIQYTSAVICQFYFTYPSDFQFLYWDMFGNFLFFITVGYTATADHLSKCKPSSSLFTASNIIQVAVMYFIQLIGQMLMIYSISHNFANNIDYWDNGGEENNYESYKSHGNKFIFDTPEANVIFLFSNFMYIFSFIGFSISKPWRKQFYTNLPFMIVFTITFTYSVLLVVVPASRLKVFDISYMSDPALNGYVLGMALLFGAIMYCNQKFILEPVSARIKLRFPGNKWI